MTGFTVSKTARRQRLLTVDRMLLRVPCSSLCHCLRGKIRHSEITSYGCAFRRGLQDVRIPIYAHKSPEHLEREGLSWILWEDWSSINLEYSTMEKSPSLERTAFIGAGFSALRCIQREAQQGGCQATVLGIWSKETGYFYRALGRATWEIFLSLFPRLSRKLPMELDCPGYGSPSVPSHRSWVTSGSLCLLLPAPRTITSLLGCFEGLIRCCM